MDTIKVYTDTWNTSSTSVGKGNTTNDDITNDVLQAINSLASGLGTISFVNNVQLLIAALDEFGNNMAGVLACVSVDLQVVGSGLAAAAAAFGTTDQQLANMFANLNTELGYYTSTATNVHLAPLTPAQQAALGSLPTDSSAVTNNPANWLNSSNLQPQPVNPAIGIGIGIIALLILAGAGLALA
ncbi:MAG TPA: hypothetical protein VKX46_01880 [Ktedonobacteraceae bacterium]|jgi:hypothetical protein|nr:hypothetical protein [Ktedonobacteraceae bacterium]